jgi:hypothetical protein
LALKTEEMRGRTLLLSVLYSVNEASSEKKDKVYTDFKTKYQTGFLQLLSSIKKTKERNIDIKTDLV